MSDETEFRITCDNRIAPTIKAFLEATQLPHPCGDGRKPQGLDIQAYHGLDLMMLDRDGRIDVVIYYDKPLPSLESLADAWFQHRDFATRAKLWFAMRKRGIPSFRYNGSLITLVDKGPIDPPPCVIEVS